MNCKIFSVRGEVLAGANSVSDRAAEALHQWLDGKQGIRVTSVTQSSHVYLDTDKVQLVELIYTIIYL